MLAVPSVAARAVHAKNLVAERGMTIAPPSIMWVVLPAKCATVPLGAVGTPV
jgi:hypothetical protein